MNKLREKLEALKKLQAEYHEKAADLTSKEIAAETAKFKELRAEIQKLLTANAKDCEGGHRPIGMFHDGTPYPFEIGDPLVRRRSRGQWPEEAVEKWNNDEWLPPREEGTVIATHTGADGTIKSKKTLKVHTP